MLIDSGTPPDFTPGIELLQSKCRLQQWNKDMCWKGTWEFRNNLLCVSTTATVSKSVDTASIRTYSSPWGSSEFPWGRALTRSSCTDTF